MPHILPPLPINLCKPVTVPIDFKNIGGTKLKYEVDILGIDSLNIENHEFPIMEI